MQKIRIHGGDQNVTQLTSLRGRMHPVAADVAITRSSVVSVEVRAADVYSLFIYRPILAVRMLNTCLLYGT